MAEDLDSLLLMTGSTCLGKLTVEAEHLPTGENATDNNCSPLRTEPTPPSGSEGRDDARRGPWSSWRDVGGKFEESVGRFWPLLHKLVQLSHSLVNVHTLKRKTCPDLSVTCLDTTEEGKCPPVDSLRGTFRSRNWPPP